MKTKLFFLLICISLNVYSQKASLNESSVTYLGKTFKVGDIIQLGYGSRNDKDFAFVSFGKAVGNINLPGLSKRADVNWSKAEVEIVKLYTANGVIWAKCDPLNRDANFLNKQIFINIEGAVDNKEIKSVRPNNQTANVPVLSSTKGKNQTKTEKEKVIEESPPPSNKIKASQKSVLNTQNNDNLKFKVGDRVEVDKAAIDSWQKGTIMPFLKNDRKDGTIYRVTLDDYARNGMYLDGIEIPPQRIRLINDAPYQNEKTAVKVGKATVDADNTLSADRPILSCPVQQSQVSKSAKPNLELFKKIIRCNKGEKAANKGYDGAVTVDVTSIQLGAPRKWQYSRDIGGGPGITIYPVKATFTYKTFYRSSTQVSENWVSIINFHVNEFGEWTSGSEESIKMGETKNIPRN